jgi:hypothetical protein
MTNKIPKWLYKQEGFKRGRQWKAKKRKEVKFALKYINNILRIGCYYMPEGVQQDLLQVEQWLEGICDACSVKRWGR